MPVKSETIAVRVSAEEKEKLKVDAAKQDLTVSKYIYNLIFKRRDNNG